MAEARAVPRPDQGCFAGKKFGIYCEDSWEGADEFKEESFIIYT